MSLRDQIDQFMADHDPSAGLSGAIDDLFDSGGFDGFDPGTILDALLHYADTSPIEVADSLSGFLAEHSDIPIEEFDFAALADDGGAHLDIGSFATAGFGVAESVDETSDFFDDNSDNIDDVLDEVDEIDDGLDDGLPDDGAAAEELPSITDESHDDETSFADELDESIDADGFDEAVDLDFDF